MLPHRIRSTLSVFISVVALAILLIVAACTIVQEPIADRGLSDNEVVGGTATTGPYPTLDDFWTGHATFEVDQTDTGLPMGESDTVILPDGRYRAYVHASDRSLGVVDSCGNPVPFPGCVVAFESDDNGRSFLPVRSTSGQVTCMIPCIACPCDSQRDHVDQQQYPRVSKVELDRGVGSTDGTVEWLMVYEYRGAVFMRPSKDGLNWSSARQLPESGIWQTWLMPCRLEESIGSHPYVPGHYDCLVGSPPGIFVADENQETETFVFVGTGQNPGSMSCYRGFHGSHASLMRKCDHNPLFTGSPTYGILTSLDAQANDYFEFRTISSADVTKIGDRYYMLYEGVRGPHDGAAGDTQFALGLARSTTTRIDGPWETYPNNPILLDLPGNIGVGHADLVVNNGKTILYTSLDGETRSRLVLQWK